MRRVRPNEVEMPFLDHLEELRWRIIWSLAAVAAGMGIGFYVTLHFGVLGRLEAPILPYLNGHHVMATHPTDGLQFTINAAMWIGGVLPLSLPFLFGLFGTALEPMVTAENYFGFVFSLVVSFGLAFELPVVVLMLSGAGLVTPAMLARYRRHAVVLIMVASAFLSPGDVVSTTLALAVPLYLLYELSVAVAPVMHRRGRRADDGIAILLAPLLLLRGRPARHAAT